MAPDSTRPHGLACGDEARTSTRAVAAPRHEWAVAQGFVVGSVKFVGSRNPGLQVLGFELDHQRIQSRFRRTG